MKFGIKIWSTNINLIKIAREHYSKKAFDYVELSAIKGTFNKTNLSLLKGIPIIIHQDNSLCNPAKKEMREESISTLKEAQKFADFLDAEYVVIHPGHDGEAENANDVLKELNDSRICMENMPGKTIDLKAYCIGRTYEELKKIHAKNYCLDISHAIKAAITLNKNIYGNIKELLKLKPKMFHISDGSLKGEVDEHMNINEGEYDFKKIAFLLKKDLNRPIILETPKKNLNTLDEDIKNINKIKEFFH